MTDSHVEVHRAKELIRVEFGGGIAAGDWEELCERVVGHPEFDPTLPVLWDLSRVERFGSDMNYAGVQRMSAHVSEIRGRSHQVRLAILSPNDAGYGIGRMFAAVGGNDFPFEVEVFRDLEGAERYLRTREPSIQSPG